MSLDSQCRWQVQVSVYCAWRIPAHLRCTQCSILLHLMDIYFLTCICLWQISQIQTCLFEVVGPGLVSTSLAFVSSSASHQPGPHGRHAQKTVNRAPIAGGGKVRHNLSSSNFIAHILDYVDLEDLHRDGCCCTVSSRLCNQIFIVLN